MKPAIGQDNLYLEGRAALLEADYIRAADALEKAKEQQAGKTDILYHLGCARYALQQYPAALEAFYEAERLRPGLASLSLARTEVKLGHQELALSHLRDHLDSRYRVAESLILLDPVLSELERSPGWQQLWNEKDWYSEEDRMLGEARHLIGKGEIPDALNLLNELSKNTKRNAEAGYEAGRIYASLNNPRAARKAYQEALKRDPKHINTLSSLARLQMEEGDYAEAALTWNRVLRQDAGHFPAYLHRAVARQASGNLHGSIEDIDLYLTYFPSHDSVWFMKGDICYEHGKYLDAMQSFNKALDLNRTVAAYYLGRGKTYAATGTLRYADNDLAMSLDLDPENGQAWFEKARVSQKLGESDAACHACRTALRLGVLDAEEMIENECTAH